MLVGAFIHLKLGVHNRERRARAGNFAHQKVFSDLVQLVVCADDISQRVDAIKELDLMDCRQVHNRSFVFGQLSRSKRIGERHNRKHICNSRDLLKCLKISVPDRVPTAKEIQHKVHPLVCKLP